MYNINAMYAYNSLFKGIRISGHYCVISLVAFDTTVSTSSLNKIERSRALCPHAHLQLMCDKNDRFAIKFFLNAFLENMFPNMSINR